MKTLKNNKNAILLFTLGILTGFLINVVLSEISHQKILEDIETLEEEMFIQVFTPINCTSSSQLNEYQGCENLYGYTSDGWEDNNQNCNDQWIEFEFSEPVAVEFVVMQNYAYEGLKAQKDSIKYFELIFKTENGENVFEETLQNTTDSQWFDTLQMEKSKFIRLNVVSSYDTLGVNTCHLQSIDFYGYNG